jgi:hypothetical protein
MAKKGKTWRPPAQSRQSASRGSRPRPETSPPPGSGAARATTAEPRAQSQPERPAVAAPNRQARKEEARRQREALRRKAARRHLLNRILAIAGGAVVVVGVVLAFLLVGSGKHFPQDLPGIQTDTEPWPAEHAHMQARLHDIHIGFLGTEALAYHIHQHLDLYVNGQKVTVPSQIGISGGFAFLHTHDSSGVIHVESPVIKDYTLGQFFDVWGVLFTKDQIGAYKVNGNDKLWVYVNGRPYTGDPRNIVLKNFEEIVVAYGTKAQLPSPIPKTYGPFERAKKAARQAGQQATTPTPSPTATPSPSASASG